MASTSASSRKPPADSGGTRTAAGSTYGDYVPRNDTGVSDPSRGAELERELLPANADFSQPPADPDPAAMSREERIRAAAFGKFQQRAGAPGDPESDWLQAEAEVDAAAADPVPRAPQ